MLLTSLLKYRAAIRSWSQSETLLGLLRQMGAEPSVVEGILRVYGSPADGEAFLDGISWAPPTVLAPWTGYALAPGTSANARINAWGFRDDRERYARRGCLFRTILAGRRARTRLWQAGWSGDSTTCTRRNPVRRTR
jgi:hypothetical protein